MYLINQITSDYLQAQNVVLPTGGQFSLTIYYVPQQYGWFITNLTYLSFTLTGLRITTNPNMLQQWKSQIPFGLGCFVTANREPTQLQDFSSGAAQLFVLSAAEVAEYSNILAGTGT